MRLAQLLLSIVTRTTYLELLVEYHAALSHLIRLCAASPMVANQLSRYPLLLDELLDPATLYQPVALDAYRSELRQYLLRVPEDDEEQSWRRCASSSRRSSCASPRRISPARCR